MIIASTHDFREAARRKLPHFLFEYIDGGSYDERTLHANVDDLKQISLRQRVLRDVSTLDLSTELFGEMLAMPVILATIASSAGLSRAVLPILAAVVASTASAAKTVVTMVSAVASSVTSLWTDIVRYPGPSSLDLASRNRNRPNYTAWRAFLRR